MAVEIARHGFVCMSINYKLWNKGINVKEDAAPMLLVHGTKDETVPHSQAVTMAAALKKAGVEHHLEIVPDAPHTFSLVSPARDFRPLVFSFLDKHLSPAKP